MMMMEGTLATRRTASNGRPQACDPCRRQKLACDHAQPCLRCKKTKRDAQCAYSPLARAPTKGKRRFSSSASTSTTPGTIGLPAIDSESPASTKSSRTRRLACLTVSSGYLGFTSFKTVYEEAQDSLSRLGAPARPDCDHIDENASDVFEARSPAIKQLCLQLLHQVPCPTDGIRLFLKQPRTFDVWFHRAAKMILDGFYDYWSDYLTPDRDDAKLESMARIICANTMKDVVENIVEPSMWISQFTGRNLRWEALGLLFNFWAMNPNVERPYTPLDREPMGMCIRICREFVERPTFCLQYLYHRRALIEALYSGDATLATWRYKAESIAILTFRGLHAELNNLDAPPTIASEIQRRLTWAAFNMDKSAVSFTGRPPLLSRHYLTTPLPLDLRDDYLFEEGGLDRAITETLDSEGWNTEGGLYYSTYTRANALLLQVADEIFEIVLGRNGQRCPRDQVLKLREKAVQTYESLPGFVIWRGEDVDNTDMETTAIIFRMFIRVFHLQNLFFVDRFLFRRNLGGGEALVRVSFEIVSLIVALWTRQDRFPDAVHDYEWIVMGYGAPAGGILCMELLKPTLQDSSTNKLPISRSSIVQVLSLLVAFLGWVKPWAPNAHLCEKTRATIEQALDYVLNDGTNAPQMPDDFGWDIPTQFDFNFDFMDSFDWLRSESNHNFPPTS